MRLGMGCKVVDVLDLVSVLPWRDEIKKHPVKSNTANKDAAVVVKKESDF